MGRSSKQSGEEKFYRDGVGLGGSILGQDGYEGALGFVEKIDTRGPWALLNWRRRSDSTSRYVEGDASRKAAQCGGSILWQDGYERRL